jgi:hypothetical protein
MLDTSRRILGFLSNVNMRDGPGHTNLFGLLEALADSVRSGPS